MIVKAISTSLRIIATVGAAVSLFASVFLIGFTIGRRQGVFEARVEALDYEKKLIADFEQQLKVYTSSTVPANSGSSSQAGQVVAPPARVEWGGPELWDLVNEARARNGVNPLETRGELCTIASLRLNELLELGKLDGHEGFGNLPDRRTDLKWIFEQYNLFEFLVAGARTAQEAVDSWNNTLGHKLLLTGGEFVWGCIYAQNGYGVAITAY